MASRREIRVRSSQRASVRRCEEALLSRPQLGGPKERADPININYNSSGFLDDGAVPKPPLAHLNSSEKLCRRTLQPE